MLERRGNGLLRGQLAGFSSSTRTRSSSSTDITYTPYEASKTVYAYNGGNELTQTNTDGVVETYAYDAWGRTTLHQRVDGDDTYTRAYSWGCGDKLRYVLSDFPGEMTTAYNYDGLGKRRNKTLDYGGGGETTTWWRWAGMSVLAEYAGAGGMTIGARSETYVPGLAQIPGSNPSTGAYQYLLADHLGSVREVQDQSQDVLARYAYTPYGEVAHAAGLSMRQGYTGHFYDAETKHFFAPYRYYAPENARWMSRDPLGHVDGPNTYAYVTNSPVNYTDDWGLKISYDYPGDSKKETKEDKKKIKMPSINWNECSPTAKEAIDWLKKSDKTYYILYRDRGVEGVKSAYSHRGRYIEWDPKGDHRHFKDPNLKDETSLGHELWHGVQHDNQVPIVDSGVIKGYTTDINNELTKCEKADPKEK